MNLSERFRAGALAAGVARGAGIVAGTGWSAIWVMLLAAGAAIFLGFITRQWVTSLAVGLALWVALPIWRPVLPGGSDGVPTVGDLIGTTTTTTTTPTPSTARPASPAGAEASTDGGEAAG